LNGIPTAADDSALPSFRARFAKSAAPHDRAEAHGVTLGEIAGDTGVVSLLESELLRLPAEVRQRLANLLLESLGRSRRFDD
jgi:hypothetical protein